jgi:hypothetical protein
MNNPEEAVEYCRLGLVRESGDKTCLYNINVALRQVGAIKEAIDLSWRSIDHTCKASPEWDAQVVRNEPAVIVTELTIVCVKWGKKYGHEYVNNLYSALQRHIPAERSWKLVCFTEDTAGISTGVECYPFHEETASWQGWWLKAQIFASHAALTGWVLYIDLDTVICDSLAFVFDLTATRTPADLPASQSTTWRAQFFILSTDDFRNEGTYVCISTI